MKRIRFISICLLISGIVIASGWFLYFNETEEDAIIQWILDNYIIELTGEQVAGKDLETLLSELKYSKTIPHKETRSNIGPGVVCFQSNGRIYLKRILNKAIDNNTRLYNLFGGEILSINGDSISGLTADQVNRLIWNKDHKHVHFEIKKLDVHIQSFPLVCQSYPYHSVLGEEISYKSKKIAYIRIKEFDVYAYANFKAAFKHYYINGVKLIIFDLRFNPGGVLDQAAQIAEVFLRKCNYGGVKATNPDDSKEYNTLNKNKYPNIKIAVLVNEETASAAEFFAGVLRTQRKAILVGEHTLGKGVVQAAWERKEKQASIIIPVGLYWFQPNKFIDQYFTFQNNKFIPCKNQNYGVKPDFEIHIPDELFLALKSKLSEYYYLSPPMYEYLKASEIEKLDPQLFKAITLVIDK